MGGRTVPEDFTAFVATYRRRLATACLEIAGNDRVADAMRTDLLAVVAAHWRLWPSRWRTRRALNRLDHLLRREVRSYRLVPDVAPERVKMSDPAPDSAADADDEPPQTLAAAAWRRAQLLQRQRRLGVATAVLVLVALALVGPRATRLPVVPDPRPTQTPAGVTVLPSFLDLLGLPTAGSTLPSQLALDPTAIAAIPPLRQPIAAGVGRSRAQPRSVDHHGAWREQPADRRPDPRQRASAHHVALGGGRPDRLAPRQ